MSIQKTFANVSRRTWVAATVVTLMLIMTAQIVHAIHGASLTWDEGDHIFAGYESWKTGDLGMNPEHPPMVKMVATLPLLPLQLTVPKLQGRYFKTESYMDGRELLFRNGPANGGHYSSETLVLRVRLFAMVFTLAAALLVFFAAQEMFSTTAGLIALAIFCFEPNLLAHGAYVTTDMGASCTFFATIYAFWRYVKQPSLARLAVTGLAAGLALAAKHSTVLLAPMLLLLIAGELVRTWRVRRRDRAARTVPMVTAKLLGAFAVIALMAITLLWAFYGFRYAARPAGLALSPTLAATTVPLAAHEAAGILFVARHHLLPESWIYGLVDVRVVANATPSFLLGKVYPHGTWIYFPLDFVIKSTLAMMVLLALTAFAAMRGWLKHGRELWFLTAPPALYFLVSMGSHLNIGARHILPVYVFCCALCGAGAAALLQHDRRWTWVVAVLLLFHAGSSLHAAPNYIAYSNEAWGGPTQTYRYLSDSNTDWAQQLIATSAYVREHNIHDCWIAYFAAPFIEPEDYGIPCRHLPTFDSMSVDEIDASPATLNGPVLVSAGDLNGFEFGSSVLNPYEPMMHAQPDAFIQDGIFVYNGTFTLPLASALSHVQRSAALLKAHALPQAIAEAQQAETIAPGTVQAELALGDALAANRDKAAANQAYGRAVVTIRTMQPEARDEWLKIVQKKVAAL
jgi:hypothetical protein